jgi:hypothetical protein
MKLAAFCLVFAWTLSAQDSLIGRLNAALQRIDAEAVHEPISLVIAVQATNKIQPAMLIDIRRIHSMLTQLIGSERAEVEVLSYGDWARVLVAQPFTTDSAKAATAIAHLKVLTGLQNSTSNMSDAIAQATSDLETRAANRRRMVLVIGEKQDETKAKEILARAERSNVVLYSIAP